MENKDISAHHQRMKDREQRKHDRMDEEFDLENPKDREKLEKRGILKQKKVGKYNLVEIKLGGF